ncbi:MAG: ABC transporter substrate binding protein [Candidatus Tectomicrobia bacterium]
MKTCRFFLVIFVVGFVVGSMGLGGTSVSFGATAKKRILVVSSYHREYLWSQATQRGLSEAMLKYGYLDNSQQIATLATQDYVESAQAVITKTWMDTKRKYSTVEIAQTTTRIMQEIKAFQPDLVLLGDDNAAHYIGNQLLDTAIPVVFWGINGLPLKYGLVERMDQPGHNVTGVWQSGYLKESLELLHALVPEAQTFAILACDSITARSKVRQLQALAKKGTLPLQLVDVVTTNSLPEFQQRTLELAHQVDAFFILNHDTLKDEHGQHVDMLTVGKWYLENIKKPEASHEGQFVQEGMLCTANDSGYNQGYTAFEMAFEILEREGKPSQMAPRTPPRGPLMVNRERAEMLGIALAEKMAVVEEVIDKALALKK